VSGLDDDGDPNRTEDLLDGVRDFLRETFLDLQSSGEHFGYPSQFGQAQDAPVRDVADMDLIDALRP
jgi:hypothetical protein